MWKHITNHWRWAWKTAAEERARSFPRHAIRRYVSEPQDWPYSSYQQAIRKGWYEADILREDDFKDMNYE